MEMRSCRSRDALLTFIKNYPFVHGSAMLMRGKSPTYRRVDHCHQAGLRPRPLAVGDRLKMKRDRPASQRLAAHRHGRAIPEEFVLLKEVASFARSAGPSLCDSTFAEIVIWLVPK